MVLIAFPTCGINNMSTFPTSGINYISTFRFLCRMFWISKTKIQVWYNFSDINQLYLSRGMMTECQSLTNFKIVTCVQGNKTRNPDWLQWQRSVFWIVFKTFVKRPSAIALNFLFVIRASIFGSLKYFFPKFTFFCSCAGICLICQNPMLHL